MTEHGATNDPDEPSHWFAEGYSYAHHGTDNWPDDPDMENADAAEFCRGLLAGLRHNDDSAPAASVAQELVAEARRVNAEGMDFDDEVRDAASAQASNVNNEGLEAQIRFLLKQVGAPRVREMLERIAGEGR